MTYTDIREDKILTDEKLTIQSGDYVCGEDGLIYCVTTWDPKLSGYVACLTAYKVLVGEPVGDGSDLSDGGAAPGYEAVKLVLDDGNNCLLGSAPCVATGENVDDLF